MAATSAGSGSDEPRGLSRLPHLDRLPVPSLSLGAGGDAEGSDALTDFLDRSRDWSRQSVPLSWRVVGALWSLVVLLVGVGSGLVVVLRHPRMCGHLWCEASTFGGHPLATLVFAACGLAAFAVLAVLTCGLTRVTARQLVAVVVASVASVAAVIGAVVVLVVLVVSVVLIALALFLALLSMVRAA
jgi:hypothetical protein